MELSFEEGFIYKTIYRVVFFYCSALKMTKYKEKLKHPNCSANCSPKKILSTRKKQSV